MQSSDQLKRFAPWALAVGIFGFIAAGAIWAVTQQADPYVQGSLAVGLLGLALAGLFNPGALQTWLMGRQARYGGNVGVMVLALFGILFILNYLAYKNPAHWDLSQDKVNTLAPESVTAVRQLPAPVKALAFYTVRYSSGQRLSTEDLLNRFKVESQGKFDYEFHDPQTEPALAKTYNITLDGTLVLVSGEMKEEISFASESEITGALIRFANPATRVVYFVTGHGERDTADSGNEGLSRGIALLTKQNYETRSLNLQISTTVPADARAVVIAGPQLPLAQSEVATLDAYLQSTPNAALIVLHDSVVESQQELTATEPLVDYLSAMWGLVLRNDVVVHQPRNAQDSPFFSVIDTYETSPITSKLKDILTIYPVARSIEVAGTPETFPNLTYTPLIKTAADEWGETDIAGLLAQQPAQLDAADAAGPLTLAVTVQNTATKARLVVVGDSGFASNAYFDAGGDSLVFTNLVNWATADENLINLTPKTSTSRTLTLRDPIIFNLIFFLTVIVMPLAVLVWGGVVWFLRRRHV